jgi:diguanylate cyclase (GGDEF)-like protein/PAS domain S-box-containing protein
MQTRDDTASGEAYGDADPRQLAQTSRRAAEALLREHPDAVIYAQRADAALVAVPESLGLDGYPVLATEGRTGMDFFVAEDRMATVRAWIRAKNEAVAEATVRLCSNPGEWVVLKILDVRKAHGVVLNLLWPAGEAPRDAQARSPQETPSTTPRFCTRKQDEEGNVIDCDEAYLQMFGYTAEEVIGQPTFERVHPEDQARVIEGWITTVATGRVQMFRIRMRRQDGSWLWVDTTLHNLLNDEQQGCVMAECIDVSAEMIAQEKLQDREELLRNLIEEMPDGLLQLDRERNLVYHNPRLLEIMRGDAPACEGPSDPADALAGEPAGMPATLTLGELTKVLTGEARQSFDAVLGRALEAGVRQDVELELELPSGAQRHVLVKVRPLQRDSGVVTGAIASVLDVTDSARARRELERRATFDGLTGAHNHASIMGVLARELETSPDTGVVYIDLDWFKSVNDTLGHAAGDEVLVEVAARLKTAMRSSDELGRLGGDEFLVLLRGVCDLEVAMGAAERISEAVRGVYKLSCASLELCASVGVAYVEDPAITAEELVERADAAMYRSKEQRRGTPVLAA